jgi:uncharacterized protein (TIGR02246 family)
MRLSATNFTSAASVLGIVLGASIALERVEFAKRVQDATHLPAIDPFREAIDRVNSQYLEALRFGDARAFASLFTEDALQFPATGAPVRGRAAIVAAMTSAFERVTFVGGSLRTVEARRDGATAYEIGDYSFAVRDRSAPPRRPSKARTVRQVSGRYAVLWRREREHWRIAVDFGQPEMPVA